MTASFNLITEPWLPVRAGDESRSVSLRDLFTHAADLTDLAVPVPPAAAGIWRILYAITARVTGLDDGADWADRQYDLLHHGGGFDPMAVEEYFERHHDAFDLFHPERPWLQDPRLWEQCPKSSGVNKLLFDRPAGDTRVWFGHYTDLEPVPVPPDQAAWYLVAQLYYGAAGRCSSRMVDGQKLADMTAGRLRAAMSYHPVGENLFQSLVMGVPEPKHTFDGPDRCPWERPDLPDPLGASDPVTWPGGLLTGGFRHAVLLVPAADGSAVTDAYLTWGAREPAATRPDPYVILKLRDGSWRQLRADGSRALWRDVHALLADRDDAHQRPDIIRSVGRVGLPFRIRAYGFHQDGKTVDWQWFTSVTPPLVDWLADHDPDAADGAYDLYAAADRVGRALCTALNGAWRTVLQVKDKKNPWLAPASAYYWSRAEERFWQNLHDRTWHDAGKVYAVLGHRAIDHATENHVHLPRFANAVATAHRMLSGR